ncbi:hypothetical protein E4U21_004037 [Claviceps maximensis]|nr:hypothetical protein E4U21_004037 [Claviceps maximensis]
MACRDSQPEQERKSKQNARQGKARQGKARQAAGRGDWSSRTVPIGWDADGQTRAWRQARQARHRTTPGCLAGGLERGSCTHGCDARLHVVAARSKSGGPRREPLAPTLPGTYIQWDDRIPLAARHPKSLEQSRAKVRTTTTIQPVKQDKQTTAHVNCESRVATISNLIPPSSRHRYVAYRYMYVNTQCIQNLARTRCRVKSSEADSSHLYDQQ